MDTKKVNIYPRGPVTTTNPPIRGVVKGVTKPIQDIRKCIIAGAKVEEIFEGGKVVLLNLTNYDLDNSEQAKTVSTPPPAAPAINYNAARAGRPRPAFSSPANVAPVESPVATPVVEKAPEPVAEPVEEAPVEAEPEATPEEPAQAEEAPTEQSTENPISQHMSRKQRRAMERAKQNETTPEESVEVQNPED